LAGTTDHGARSKNLKTGRKKEEKTSDREASLGTTKRGAINNAFGTVRNVLKEKGQNKKRAKRKKYVLIGRGGGVPYEV